MAPATLPSRRRMLPQFSLRALLVLVTLSAIGTAIWYRWPFEEEVKPYEHSTPQIRSAAENSPYIATRELRTVRRVWGGERIRHGWTRGYNAQGNLLNKTFWQENLRHGPTQEWRADGTLSLEGAYLNGEKDGVWKVYGRTGKLAKGPSVQSWQRGKPHGKWMFFDSPGTVSRTVELRDGAVVRIDGKAVDDPLMAKSLAGTLDQHTHKAVMENTELDFVQTALKDVVVYLKEAHGVPIELATRSIREHGISVDEPITENLNGVPLSIALAVMLQPHGLVADYHFGCIMICPAAEAKIWRDRTGVSEIKPRPGSALARQWEQPVTFGFVETDLKDAMTYVTEMTGVLFNVSDPTLRDLTITQNLRSLSLKNSLGILCEGANLHVCQDGDTLVIEPQAVPAVADTKP